MDSYQNLHDRATQLEMERKEKKNLAGLWRERLDTALEAFEVKEDKTLDGLVDIYWNEYILGRLVPEDPKEKQARVDLKKEVWETDRNDPELYSRILVSLYAAQETLENAKTASGGGFGSGAIFETLPRLYMLPQEEMKKLNVSGQQPYEMLIHRFEEKTNHALQETGGIAPSIRLRVKATGVHLGIPVKIKEFYDNGLVSLVPLDSSPRAMVEFTEQSTQLHPDRFPPSFSLSELDLETFQNPEAPETFSTSQEVDTHRSQVWRGNQEFARIFEEANIPKAERKTFGDLYHATARQYPDQQIVMHVNYKKGTGFTMTVSTKS